MKIEVNDELIARYLSGEALPEEAMALNDWLQNPVNQFHFMSLQKAWSASYPGKSRPVNIEKGWKTLSSKMATVNKTPASRNFYNTTFRIAASILFVAIVGIALYRIFGNATIMNIAVESRDSIQHVQLADHSTITLFRNSTLTYPPEFGKQRHVLLATGEAFFNIATDKTKPFLIQTPLAKIKVLGTSFNVTVHASSFEISVAHGKVMAYTLTDSVYLEAGDAGKLHAGDKSFNIQKANPNTWSYASHKFVFNNTPLREVFSHVEKAQHCSIVAANKNIENCKLTATFESVSTEYMLTLITEALNLSVVTNDDHTFTVGGEGCP